VSGGVEEDNAQLQVIPITVDPRTTDMAEAIRRLNAAVRQLQETATQNRSRIVELEKIINN
jgi:uncharacterized protein YgbK (DUF1537 family)